MSRRPRVAHLATTDMTVRFLLMPQLERLADEGWDVVAISADGPWVDEIEAAGIRHVTWPHAGRAWDPREDLRAFVSLTGILRQERPDVLHCHNPKPGILGRFAGRMARVPVVLNTVHGFYATPEDPAKRRIPVVTAERLAARCSTFELYQSEEDLSWARGLGIAKPGRSALLGNGVDLTRFDAGDVSEERRAKVRAELGVGDDELLVGTIGRMVAEKGYRELFEAAALVRAARPQVRFLAVGGPDPDKADSITLQEMDDARADVIMTGWRTDVVDLLAAMDVFVLASWREGLPRAAVEAAAMGLPLILTDIRGCREVAGTDAGILVAPRSATAIARAVGELADDPDRRAQLGRAAAQRARARFDERRVLADVARLSRSLAGGVAAPHAVPQVTVRRARPADAARIAALHTETMPTAFLPSLGASFLARFHAGLIAFPEAAAYVAEADGSVAGFVVGVPSMRRFASWFAAHRGLGAAASALPHVLSDPASVRGMLESLRYAARPAAEGIDLPEAELIAIAVDPAQRGRGVGLALGEAFLDAMVARGVDGVRVVVGPEYEAALGLYGRLGFEPAADLRLHEGTSSRVLVTPGVREGEMRGTLRRT